MANVKVDYGQIENAVSVIETYITKHKNNMGKMNQSVTALGASWQCNDYSQLKSEWNQINSKDSTSGKMLQELDEYADFLRFAANKYKSAQNNAINRANRLPKY